MYKIFDIHTHIYPEAIAERAVDNLNRFYSFVCEAKGTLPDIDESSKQANVLGCLLLGVATNQKQMASVNEYLAKACADYTTDSFKMLAFGCVHQDCENMAALADEVERLGLKGFKIHPDIQGVNIDDERLFPLYEAIEGRLPIYFHIGDDRDEYQFSSTERLVRILKQFPKLTVVAAHLGGYRSWHKISAFKEFDNVLFDTSSALWAMSPEVATNIIHELGTDKVMFGTDYPVAYAESELERFFSLGLNEQERKAILYDNAARFLGL